MPLRIDTPVLHSERLTLRPVKESDIATVQQEFARWSIIQYLSMGVPWPYPDDGAHSRLVLPSQRREQSVRVAVLPRFARPRAQ